MRKIRSLKPEWLEHERLGGCSDAARVLSIGLLLLADDHGNGRASPRLLAAQVWPYADKAIARAEAALEELISIGFVERYAVAGQTYFTLPSWTRHQRIDNASRARVPGPNEADSSTSPGGPRFSAASRGESRRVAADRGGSPLDAAETRGDPPRKSAGSGSGSGSGSGRDRDGEGDPGEGDRSPEARGMTATHGAMDHDPDSVPDSLDELLSEAGCLALPAPVLSGPGADLAVALRLALATEKPNHELADETAWSRRRLAWSRQMDGLLKLDGRTPEAAMAILGWVFGDQDGADFRFRVDSPKALREKWDRIEVAMRRPRLPRGGKPRDQAAELMERARWLESQGR